MAKSVPAFLNSETPLTAAGDLHRSSFYSVISLVDFFCSGGRREQRLQRLQHTMGFVCSPQGLSPGKTLWPSWDFEYETSDAKGSQSSV